ncbi:MAG: glutathione peroxidase [Lentisphaeria bacterium]|nr:glutathione peroxidase [Lentisphaeria bacterium]MDY0177519.1 glutathione peroxidase [Lentisphaeria bacterium]NMA19371.1 glutathione peroxidase [Lentisphaerota bacterium]
MSELYQIKVNSIDGKETTLDFLRGKVALVVNVASRCGFTPQYQGLEELYRKYGEKGLVILGFPCNQFGGQEPGSDSEIASFCTLKYEVSFPMFAKLDVNGKNAHPLFVYLKAQAPGVLGSEAIKWNFSKFLISRDGRKIKRFASIVKPAELEADILALINEPITP